MFDTICPSCEKRQLVFPAQVSEIINDEQGIVAVFTCWCGAVGAERLRTTAGSKQAPVPDHAMAS